MVSLDYELRGGYLTVFFMKLRLKNSMFEKLVCSLQTYRTYYKYHKKYKGTNITYTSYEKIKIYQNC